MVQGLKQRLRRGVDAVHWYVEQMVRQFLHHDGLATAGTLTYTTLFAIVPFVAVSYRIFAAMPEFEEAQKQVEAYIFNNFLPSMGSVVQEKILEFSTETGRLTEISVVFLFVTSFLTLVTVEKTFNKVWHVPESRSGLQRVLIYWSVLSLGPLLIGAGLVISLYFTGMQFVSDLNVFGIGDLLLSHLPKLLNIAAFTVLYYAVPNCEVPFKHALAGGVLTMVVFSLVQWAFTEVVPYLSFNAVYGAFAALPIFLIWIYIVWVVVVAGLIFVRCLSLKRDVEPTPEPLVLKAARVLRVLASAHEEGRSVTEADLRGQVQLNSDETERVFAVLRSMRLLQTGEQERWILGRSLRSVTLWELYQALPENVDEITLRDIDDLPGVVEPIRAITQFGSNEMSVSLETALGSQR